MALSYGALSGALRFHKELKFRHDDSRTALVLLLLPMASETIRYRGRILAYDHAELLVAGPRVLVITACDVAGQYYYLAQEMRRRALADVRVLTLGSDPAAGDPRDLAHLYDGGAELEAILDRCDAIHVVDLPPTELECAGRSIVDIPGIKICAQVDGRNKDLKLDTLRAQASERGWALVSTRPGAAKHLGAKFLAPFVPWWRGPWRPLLDGCRSRESVRRPGIVFTSSRMAIDTRPTLESMLDDAEDYAAMRNHKHGREVPQVYMETVVRRPHRQVLQRRRFAHLTLTYSEDGLSLSALESLAQGVPVIADLSVSDASAYAALCGGELPPVRSRADLATTVDEIRARAPGDATLSSWARRCLDPERWFETCGALWRSDRFSESAA